MATVNAVQGFIMCGLQAQFQPDLVALLLILAEQVQHRLRHTVRTRTDAQPHNVRLRDCLLIHGPQHLHFRPGTGVRLEIGQILLCAVNPAGLMCELLCNRFMLLSFVSKGGHVTESAATAPDGAIAIRTAKTAVQRQLVNLLPVALQKIPTKHID